MLRIYKRVKDKGVLKFLLTHTLPQLTNDEMDFSILREIQVNILGIEIYFGIWEWAN